MTSEQKEKFLLEHGWIKLNETQWAHEKANYICHIDVAVELQTYRNENY